MTRFDWVTSDWHAFHGRLRVYEPSRPPNFWELLRERYLERVRPEHTVLFLGDLAWGSRRRMQEFFQALPGHKILVRGNHDKGRTDTCLRAAGFEEIHPLGIVEEDVLFSHYPLSCKDPRYAAQVHALEELMQEHQCTLNVHGHIHHRTSPDPRCVNVSVERTDFFPVTLEWARQQQVLSPST